MRAIEERQVVCPQSWNSQYGFWKVIPALRAVFHDVIIIDSGGKIPARESATYRNSNASSPHIARSRLIASTGMTKGVPLLTLQRSQHGENKVEALGNSRDAVMGLSLNGHRLAQWYYVVLHGDAEGRRDSRIESDNVPNNALKVV